jgi:molybdopterin molybdotransferase
MAQLTDDCFAFSGPLMPVAEVERIIGERVTPVAEIETVALAAAAGRVVARDIVAPIALPPFDNSAVDGYAVRHTDLDPKAETRLAVVERVTAGRAASHALGPGTAVRIFTGAPMPAGADTVFMQEDVRADGTDVIVPPGLKLGANRRLAGEDVCAGAVVLPAGRRLLAQDVALAAAVGLTQLPVRRRLRVAVFSTGDEIVEPGAPRPAPALFDANRYLLAGLLARLGAVTSDLGILPDDPERLARAIAKAAADHDLVLTSGGVSTGEADHVRSAVETVGKLVFWRVAIKPGRPVAMGVIPGARAALANEASGPRGDPKVHAGAAFVGLPGNPAAVYVTFVRVVRPLLLRLAGAEPLPLIALPVRSSFAYRKKKGRREYVRVKLVRGADGAIEAVKHAQEGAGVITSLTETDGLVELPEDTTSLEPGATVGFLSYAALAS